MAGEPTVEYFVGPLFVEVCVALMYVPALGLSSATVLQEIAMRVADDMLQTVRHCNRPGVLLLDDIRG